MTGFFDKIEIRKDAENFVRNTMEIADEIQLILKKKKMSQKDLANLLCKKEPEISRWLSGVHNITPKTIAKIEAVLDERILIPVSQAPKFVFTKTNISKVSPLLREKRVIDLQAGFRNIQATERISTCGELAI